jgi:2'-5' RNA ligase
VRLFVAVVPPAEVVGEIAGVVAGRRREWPGLTWMPEEQWHVTLAFLGEVEEETVPGLESWLGRVAARHAPMSLAFSGAGTFPSASRARVFWVGVDEGPGLTGSPLGALASSIAAAARRAGVDEIDRKRFHPHLTLARSRHEVDVRPLVETMGSFAGRRWEAGVVHLMRSHQGPPVRYESLASWPLGAGRRARSVGGPG